MNAIDKTGGPAFPIVASNLEYIGASGMTLRDYFAAKAMAIVPEMTAYNMKDNETRADYTARMSYKIADAMLTAREETND